MRREKLGDILKSKNLTGNGVEVGVANGDFSQVIINDFGLKKVYLVDHWKEYRTHNTLISQKEQDVAYSKVCDRFAPHKNVSVIRGLSDETANNFPDSSFDFVYIDACHFYKDVCKDIKAWFPKVKNGGMFGGHDYKKDVDKDTVNGVYEAVNEFCAKHNYVVNVTHGTKRCPSSWYIFK